MKHGVSSFPVGPYPLGYSEDARALPLNLLKKLS